MFELDIADEAPIDRINVRRLMTYLENALENCLLDDTAFSYDVVRDHFCRQAEAFLANLQEKKIIQTYQLDIEDNNEVSIILSLTTSCIATLEFGFYPDEEE